MSRDFSKLQRRIIDDLVFGAVKAFAATKASRNLPSAEDLDRIAEEEKAREATNGRTDN